MIDITFIDGNPASINESKILMLKKDDDFENTIIVFDNEEEIIVKESIKTIEARINSHMN